jgi:hypothetical protein
MEADEEALGEDTSKTELWEGSLDAVSPLEESTRATSESELERPDVDEKAAAADVVDLQIPATQVAPQPALVRPGEHPPKIPASSARRFRRAKVAMAVALVLGGGAWGAYTAFAGPTETPPPTAAAPSGEEAETAPAEEALETADPPLVAVDTPRVAAAPTVSDSADNPDPSTGGGTDENVSETAEQQLSEFEQQFNSFVEFAQDVPDALAEAADSVAGLIFDRSEGIPELHAHAAAVRARARGYLDDLCGAERWWAQAADLVPDNSFYGTQREMYRAENRGAC